ncbi:hypothetical protein KOR34_31140 [Posidoniimonas corsicana]|uniref:Uncharacterized protein n=1 Tax=Posidoniimonas corsicana TaxID=1938618 RepID=A0A5C5VHT8_9BACT|nr:hypothetical protein [Posidoniimonas corsicana]TWT38146.1 hypothetical protein KOR34_31140 [Posidoniimonas corsicana]
MTTQIKDSISYDQFEYGIVGFYGEGLFVPSSQNIEVQTASSDCWRGFHCRYIIRNDQLFLYEVTLGLSEQDRRLIQQGRGPSVFARPICLCNGDEQSWSEGQLHPCQFREQYGVSGLEELTPFTGGLLLARDFVWERHEDLNFHPAFQYRTVIEIRVEKGVVIESTSHADPHDASPTPDFSRYSYHSY